MKHRKLRRTAAALTAAFMVMFFISCGAGAPEETAVSGTVGAPAPEITPDLTVPPPGSPATQEKWDGFDEAKKQEAWAKYIAENSAGSVSTGSPAETEPAPAVTVSKAPPVAVVAGKLTRAPISLYYYGIGELKAGEERRVSPQAAGTVAALYVHEGDFVEEGDLLFSLDDSDLARELELVNEKWDAELELALIRLNDARSDFESSSSLYARDLISKAENDAAGKSLEEAEIAYEKVRLAKTTELGKLQESLRTTIGLSPGRGYISDITFRKDEQVNSADFIEIVDIENLLISVPVPENIIARISVGGEVLAKQPSAPAYALTGTVSSKGLVSDSNRSFEVLARLDNPDLRLLPGMLMEVQIRIAQLTTNFIIPRESLIQDGGDRFIFIIENDAARRVPVTTGQSRGELVQISGAVEEGDLLVLQGQSYLREGAAVTVVETRTYLPERREL